jgi:hypothetical protein
MRTTSCAVGAISFDEISGVYAAEINFEFTDETLPHYSNPPHALTIVVRVLGEPHWSYTVIRDALLERARQLVETALAAFGSHEDRDSSDLSAGEAGQVPSLFELVSQLAS